MSILVDLCNDFKETEKGQVSQVLILFREFAILSIMHYFLTKLSEELFLMLEFPDQ